MDGTRVLLMFLGCVLTVSAQGPNFGGCPEKNAPMTDFDLSKYLGVWYESERSFTVLEAGSRCVKTNYTQTSDGKIHVQNEAINRITGIKRVLEGEMKAAGKANEGKINIRYSTPVPLDATYNVLKTDYETYSVIWYCLNFGLFNAQYAWIMTRERQAPGVVMQAAYGVLDEFDIPRTLFVKTPQEKCEIASEAPDIIPANPSRTEDKPSPAGHVKTPAKEMLPPEPAADVPKQPEVEMKPESAPMEDVPKAPAEPVQDKETTPDKNNIAEAPAAAEQDSKKKV